VHQNTAEECNVPPDKVDVILGMVLTPNHSTDTEKTIQHWKIHNSLNLSN